MPQVKTPFALVRSTGKYKKRPAKLKGTDKVISLLGAL